MIEYTTDIDLINKFLKYFGSSITELGVFSHYMIYKEEDVLGFLSYQVIYDRIEIDYLYVDESNRKKGIASRLVNNMIKYAYENSAKNITLEVKESNTQAISFYKKNLFKEVAIRKNYYKNEDGILMIRELN